ncbi:Apolipoprotein N-acyltransferase [Ferriphaselus amnicola]|uniref:Apolipoprotein N-acyltransferase n=1 Tax=Ferriphaselus amnicola TaxID=1188319 RepID=A0A2Z6GES3_9PROT|nr:apolipoprotein N-acyltransferase [Ferriphaselus amnicola]BBE51907.1 Apolipoprotein N-acyltransferase [Ferriphaselus amnicola]
MKFSGRYSVFAFLAGAAAVVGFAPFGLFLVPVISIATLFVLWLRADSAWAAFKFGWSFGLGLFVAGVSWLYVALHDYGGMVAPLAAGAILLFAAFLALLPGLVGYVQARCTAHAWVRLTLAMPACWVALELVRGYLLTGFPWLSLGYSQTPPSPLAGYAPLVGLYGVSLLVVVSAGLLAWAWTEKRKAALGVLAVLWLAGAALRLVEWTQPQGAPLKVALVQGNIPQERKFEEGFRLGTLDLYRDLIAQSGDARLVVLPESALPLLREQLPPDYVAAITTPLQARRGDVLLGLFEREGERYFNSVLSLGASPEQHYRKNHLVPFGEFIPLRPLLGALINDVLQIPMSDLARGGTTQAPLEVAGQKVAVNICYEDVFGEEIVRPLATATLLVNVTNDAWYGHSHAAAQHNQISQMRALESGRMMLRATNTGITSIIGRDGKVQAALPQFQEAVLIGMAQGYTGLTPYARWGNLLVLGLLVFMLGGARLLRKSFPLPQAEED